MFNYKWLPRFILGAFLLFIPVSVSAGETPAGWTNYTSVSSLHFALPSGEYTQGEKETISFEENGQNDEYQSFESKNPNAPQIMVRSTKFNEAGLLAGWDWNDRGLKNSYNESYQRQITAWLMEDEDRDYQIFWQGNEVQMINGQQVFFQHGRMRPRAYKSPDPALTHEHYTWVKNDTFYDMIFLYREDDKPKMQPFIHQIINTAL